MSGQIPYHISTLSIPNINPSPWILYRNVNDNTVNFYFNGKIKPILQKTLPNWTSPTNPTYSLDTIRTLPTLNELMNLLNK